MMQILISSSVLILVLALLRKILRGKVSFRLQYALWLLVALRLLLPFQIGHSAYSVTSLSSPQTQAAQSFLARPLTESPAPQDPTPQQKPVVQTPPVSQIAAVQPEAQPETPSARQETAEGMTVGEVLKLIWLCGVGCMAIWFIAVNFTFRRKARKNAQGISAKEFPLPVYLTENIPSPCLVGLVFPRVYLTVEAAQDGKTMRHVLTHELMHYRHGDHLWALVRAVCLCIYWFNPLVWWAASLSRRDGELACDEGALRRLGEEERIPYGRTLVSMIAEAGRADRLLQTATTMKATKKQMKERIQMIARKPKKLIAALLCLLLIVSVTVGCTFTGGEAEKPDLPSASTQESTQPEPESTQPTETTPEEDAPVIEYYSSADGSFRLPRLAIRSSDADNDNARILETFGENETASDYSGVDYAWAQNGDVVSLVVRGTRKDTGETERLIYNLNRESGAELTIEELYTRVFDSDGAYQQQLGKTASACFAKELREILLASPDGKITDFELSPALEQELHDALRTSPETVYLQLVIDAFLQTNSYENLNAVPLWLDESGDLWCCPTIYPPKGGIEERELCLTRLAEPEQYDAAVTPRVIELYTAESGYTNEDGTPSINHIPFVLASGDYANEVNGEILRTFLQEGLSGVEYSWAVNGDILSIAAEGTHLGQYALAANIDLRTGAKASNAAVYGAAGLTEEEYLALARQALVNRLFTYMRDIPAELGTESYSQWVDEPIARTEKNVSSAVPYLDEQGKLWIRGIIHPSAGGQYSEELIPLTDMELLPEYVAYLEYIGQ